MKKVVITGTSRGIGFELAKCFADQGYQVLALSRNSEPLEALGLEQITSLRFDITKAEDIAHVRSWVTKEWGKLDILVHNAGRLLNKPFEETSSEAFETVYKVNVFGVANLTRALLPLIDRRGHVVGISSMGGVQGSAKFPGLAAYSSSKGALGILMELLAQEYADQGPSFNVLALGAVQTEMLAEAFPGYRAPIAPAQMAKYIADFAISGQEFYNGKVLPVSKSTP